MLYFFSLIGIGLVIGFITLPFVGLFVILRGRKEFSCLSCGMLARRYPQLSMGAGFRMRCGYCGQKTLIPSNSPKAQQVMAGSVTPLVWTGAPPPVFSKPGISRAMWRFIGFGSAIAVGIFILFVIIGNLLPSPPNQSGASQPSAPIQEIQGSAPTQKDSDPTPEEAEKVKQVNLGADAMLATWRVTPLAFNEQENLRFDAVVVMPNDTVCLWVHDANPVPGVIYPTSLFYFPRSKTLLSLSDVTFDLWMRECKKQEGIGVLPDIEANFNQIREKMYDLNQTLHNSQQ